FLPTASTPVTYTGNGATFSTFDTFLQQLGKCATSQEGQVFVRNSCRAPWLNNLNLRFTIRVPIQKAKIDITFDMLNFLNLLNQRWGGQLFVNFHQISNIGAVFTSGQITGYNLATINPVAPLKFNPFVYDDVRSRWQFQLGAKVSF